MFVDVDVLLIWNNLLSIFSAESLIQHYTILTFFYSGDEILEVNGDSLQGLTHQQAIQTFKVKTLVSQ